MIIKFIDRETGQQKTETPPGEGLLKFFYTNPLGKLSLGLVAKRKLVSSLYGKRMDNKKSISKIQGFVDQLGIDMSESVKNISEFTSFNDFFYRKLKPSARPIQEGIVSPGDGKALAFNNIEDIRAFFVKGNPFTIEKFIDDPELAKKFKSSSMIIVRLAPNDYHRFHFPYSGHVSESVKIRGSYYSVSPYALFENFTRVFCENKREYTLLQTADKGDMLVVPVGATMVGTIIETYKPNSSINKGEEMGYFAFGGSTVVLFLDKNHTKIDQDLIDNTKNGIETFIKMGSTIAR